MFILASIYDKIYALSPTWVQNIGISFYGWIWNHRRFSGNFQKFVLEYQSRETFTEEDWLNYQSSKLRKVLGYAYLNVPYYRNLFINIGLQNFQQFSLGDLQNIPSLEKETIRQGPQAFISQAKNIPKLFPYHTSGTTGTPIDILFSKDMHRNWSAAYDVRVRGWAGVNHKMSRAMIGGRMVVPKANSNPPFWRYNRVERQLYMSAFHISPQNASHYVKALNHYQPDYLVGYASSHFFLARFILEQGLKVIKPKAILTSSEKLTAEMREVIEQAYNCEVFDAYSGVEACCLVSECKHHNLHISPDVGIIEIMDEDGNPMSHGQPGEIVATGLLNFEQPLIRYRTGDMAILSDEKCACGRHMPILKELVGRLEDTVIGLDGRETVRFHGIFIDLPNVVEGQVIQETLTDFVVRLVVKPGFGENEKQLIRNRFQSRLGTINLQYEIVDRIERTHAGKFKAVMSKVKRSDTISSHGRQ